MDPNQPLPSQSQPPQYQPGGPITPINGSSPDYGDDGNGHHLGKWIKLAVVLILGLGIIGGTIYGLSYIMGISNQKTGELSVAKAAFEEELKKTVYIGDGSDILKVKAPKVTLECPTGFTKTKNKKECIAEATTVSPVHYNCEKGSDNSETDPSKCIRIEGGTKETASVSRNVTCEDGLEKSGEKCRKIEKTGLQKVYECTTAGYEKIGDGPQTNCLKRTAFSVAPLVSCPGGFVIGTSSCSKKSPASKSTSYPDSATSCPNPSGFTLQKTNNVCSRKVDGQVVTRPANCISPYRPLNDNTCIQGGISKVTVVTGYHYRWLGCKNGSTAYGNHQCKFTVARVRGQCPTGTSPTCYRLEREPGIDTPITAQQCPSGTAPNGSGYGPCSRTIAREWISSDQRSCPAGSLRSDNICAYSAVAKITYRCGSTIVSGPDCVQTASLIRTCGAGLDKEGNGSGTICTKSEDATKPPTVRTGCGGDFKQSGDGCEKITIKNAIITETCNQGWKRSGSKCSHIVGGTEIVTTAKITRSCPSNFKQEGKGEDMTCTKKGLKKVKLQKAYACEDGWKLRVKSKSPDCVLVAS